MNFFTRFCATLGAETLFERARLAATYPNTTPPEEEDIKNILKSLSGQDPETDRRIAFGSIVRKLKQPNCDQEGWILIIKSLIIIDRYQVKGSRCVSDGVLLKEFCELDLSNLECRQERYPMNSKLLLQDLIVNYYQYVKFKSQKLRVSFSLSLYKKEKNLYFAQMSPRQIYTEITLILQFVNKAFNVIDTKKCGHLKYQINQYLFLMLLNDLFKYYACGLVGFNELLKRIEQLDISELINLAEVTRMIFDFSVKLEQFINCNRYIKGFEYVEMEYQIQPEIVQLVIEYLNIMEGTKPLKFNTYTSQAILEQICNNLQLIVVEKRLTAQQSRYLENYQQASKLQLYINQFKHQFDENKFQNLNNNFSTSKQNLNIKLLKWNQIQRRKQTIKSKKTSNLYNLCPQNHIMRQYLLNSKTNFINDQNNYMDIEEQQELKTEKQVTRQSELLPYIQTLNHLNLNDFKESLLLMKLLIVNQRQAFQSQQWNYEIHIRQPSNVSFLILMIILQLVIALLYQLIYCQHPLLGLIKHMTLITLYGYGVVICLRKAIPKEQFQIVFILQAFLYSLFLFTIYNYCLLFIVNLFLKEQIEINNIINFLANYQFYYSIFKQISCVNMMKQPEYLLLPIGFQAIIFFGLCLLRIDYFEQLIGKLL